MEVVRPEQVEEETDLQLEIQLSKIWLTRF